MYTFSIILNGPSSFKTTNKQVVETVQCNLPSMVEVQAAASWLSVFFIHFNILTDGRLDQTQLLAGRGQTTQLLTGRGQTTQLLTGRGQTTNNTLNTLESLRAVLGGLKVKVFNVIFQKTKPRQWLYTQSAGIGCGVHCKYSPALWLQVFR